MPLLRIQRYKTSSGVTVNAHFLTVGSYDANNEPVAFSLDPSLFTSLGNYAVAVTGVTDNSPGGPFVVPVTLASTANNEGFPTADPLTKPPAAKRTTITVTVTIPDTTQAYRLYQYTRFSAVPRGSFNAAAVARPADVARSWDIPAGSGSTYTVKLQNVSTAGTYVFRAVPVSAP